MTNAVALSSPSVSLPPVTYKGLPVCTTEMLADAYGCPAKNIRMNFAHNRDRFVEGKHFIAITNGEIKDFTLQVKTFGLQISPKTRHLTLWLERGAARHAKMLNTDKAWDVFEMLEETFFRVGQPQPGAQQPAALTVSTTASRKPVEKLLKVWASQAGLPHAQCWTMLNAAFNLGSIAEMPEQWLPDAAAWIQAKIDSLPKSLPQAGQALPAVPNAVLDAGTYECGKPFFDDVNRLRRNAEAVREALHVFARPGGRSMILSDEKQMLYDNANEAANMAVSALNQAIYALRMIYNIRAHVSFSR